MGYNWPAGELQTDDLIFTLLFKMFRNYTHSSSMPLTKCMYMYNNQYEACCDIHKILIHLYSFHCGLIVWVWQHTTNPPTIFRNDKSNINWYQIYTFSKCAWYGNNVSYYMNITHLSVICMFENVDLSYVYH